MGDELSDNGQYTVEIALHQVYQKDTEEASRALAAFREGSKPPSIPGNRSLGFAFSMFGGGEQLYQNRDGRFHFLPPQYILGSPTHDSTVLPPKKWTPS